ncbi:MAG: 2'-5' RNA ligase family protein [Rectinemataceae bacterium]
MAVPKGAIPNGYRGPHMSLDQFICVSVLPGEFVQRIEPLRSTLAALSGAREALSYPLHVTLRTGFLVPPEDESALFEEFGSAIGRLDAITMRTKGLRRESYGVGGVERFLIAYEVLLDDELRKLHEALLGYTRFMKGAQYEYRPHLTLAFHDLSPEGFAVCSKWFDEHPVLGEVSYEWSCDNVCLCSKVGERWVERLRCRLGRRPGRPGSDQIFGSRAE